MTQRNSGKIKKAKRKPEKLEFVQDFIPIKDLRHGIIQTTDGRYIKILEIEPINFMLRSDDEQFSIISTFASWLKISPMRLQFKSVTRRADSDKHVAMVREELESEPSAECRRLGDDYIRLIKDVGSREALTRRFFLIFQYEELRRNETEDFAQIYGAMQTAEQNARAYFMQCGNSILQPEDPDEATAEILYMFFNRRSCVDEPFSSRVERVVVDTMAAKNKVIGIDEVPHIRFSNFIAPRGIDLKHHNHVIMDGLYYSFLFIKGDGYPSRVRAGWMSSLINAGEGVDIDVFLRRENRSKTIDKVAQRIRLNRTKIKSMQDTSTDYEELANSIQAGYYIKQGIANYNEDLFYMSVFITILAKTYEELMWRKQQMTDMLKSMDMYVSDCSFQQEAALRSVMPFLKIAPSLEKKARRNVLTSGAASTYMFTSYELSDDTGVLLGINRHNNSLCIVDLFNTKKNKNANLNLIGTSGAGKTFTLQLLALRMRMRGIQCYIMAPIKGHEFRRACNAVGGQFIRIAPGSPHCINIMEIRHTMAPEMELIDAMDYVELGSMLANKIQQLMIFFSLLIPDMTNEEEQLLDEALIKTYAEFGITHDNDSVYEDISVSPPNMKEFYEYLRSIGKSENTSKNYCDKVRIYHQWCVDSFGTIPLTLFRANVLDYISYMRNIKSYHPKSINNHLSSLRAYNEFLISSGCQTEMAILKNDFMKVQVQYANPCTVEQKDVEAFRQRLLESGSKRDFAIVTLYTYTGIRRSECVNLKLEHVDLVAKEIYIVGKGDKYRTVYLNDKTVHAIREYLKVRNSESPYLFVSRQSDRMAASRINQIFNQYSDIITPKMLRHYFCSHALDTGEYRIHEVANQAGHSNVQTTLIYSNPSAKQMKEKANKL